MMGSTTRHNRKISMLLIRIPVSRNQGSLAIAQITVSAFSLRTEIFSNGNR